MSPARRPLDLNVLAAVLILMSSFTHFVRSQHYHVLVPEIVLALLGIVAVGVLLGIIIAATPRLVAAGVIAALLTWFIDVNVRPSVTSPLLIVASVVVTVTALLVVSTLPRHFGPVGSAIFGTILISTLVLEPGLAAIPAPGPPPGPARENLPTIIHLILDEHIGLAGIPDATERGRALRTRLQAFYKERGFFTFPRAFSQYFNSHSAIAHAFNFKSTFDATLVAKAHGTFAWRMSRNAYMSHLWRRGYRIHVYQPDYMNLCPQPPAAAARCHTYRVSSFKAIEATALSTSAKLRVAVSNYLNSSVLYRLTRHLYESVRTKSFARHVPLPEWTWERSRVSTIASMSTLDAFRMDLVEARRGDFFLAHLLIPHWPYLYDRTCALEHDVSRWVDRGLFAKPTAPSNIVEAQAIRNALYFDQVECVTRKVDEVLDALRARGMLDDAIILVHGDHGSRITPTEPTASTLDKLTAPDFTASFSTLFAIRAPGVQPASDDHPWSLTELMRHFATEDFTIVPVTYPGQPVAEVYLRDDRTGAYQPVPPKMAWSDSAASLDR